ncbi:MAG: hypothetical protein FIA99_10195 [Ruminiclostridium sp.]|nr:hypothetical protein [Ruminiclostridium sp.]
MRYVNRYKDNNTPEAQPIRMPAPCGTFNGTPPPGGFGGYQQLSQQLQTPSTQVMPSLPTGYPTGGTAMPLLPPQTGIPVLPESEQAPATVQSVLYTPGFLKTQIGRRMRVEFLIGTGALVDRTGTLLSVGASYILLQMVDSNDIMMCDIYSIKFVTIFR